MLLLFLSGVSILALQTSAVQERLARELEQRFDKRFAGELRISGLEGSLPLHLHLKDVLILPPGHGQDSTLARSAQENSAITIESVYLRIDFSQTLFERFTISDIQMVRPSVNLMIDEDGRSNLQEALSRKGPARSATSRDIDPRNLPELNVSMIEIIDGDFYLEEFPEVMRQRDDIRLPESLRLSNVDMLFDIQFSGEQQFVNISRLEAQVPDLNMQRFSFSGQLYADRRFVEFNRFNLSTPGSQLRGNLSLEGSSYAGETLRQRLEDKTIRLSIEESRFKSSEFSDLLSALPDTDEILSLDVQATYEEGNAIVDRLQASVGESNIQLNGEVNQVFEAFEYRLEIETARLHKEDMLQFGAPVSRFDLVETGAFQLSARLRGNADSLNTSLNLRPPEGDITITGNTRIKPPYTYELSMDADQLNPVSFMQAGFESDDRLNMSMQLSGTGITREDANASLQLNAERTQLKAFRVDTLELDAALDDGFIEPQLLLTSGEGRVEAEGWIDLLRDELHVNLNGSSRNIDLAQLLTQPNAPESRLNSSFSLTFSGQSIDRYAGELYLNVFDTDFQDEFIENHEFILSLNDADAELREFSIGGTLLEADISSSMKPSELVQAAGLWAAEMKKTAARVSYYHFETAAEDTSSLNEKSFDGLGSAAEIFMNSDQELDVSAQIDDLTLLSKVFKGVPAINTIANMDARIRMQNGELEAETEFVADLVDIQGISADSLIFRSNANFTPGRSTDFLSGETVLQFASVERGGINIEQADLMLDIYDEAVVLQRLRAFTGEDVELGAMASAVFSRQDIDIRIMDFFVGDDQYEWQNIGQTPITLDRKGRIHVDRLEFGNLQERFIIEGTFSENPEDSVSYLFSELQLDRISRLIDGKIDFSGVLNGSFFTRSLRTDPNFLGDLTVKELRLDEQPAGDLRFSSRFNPEERQFDTRLQLTTEDEAYEDYLNRPDTGGQRILIEGPVRTLGSMEDTEEDLPLVELDVDVGNVDLWFIPLILENIFTETSGQGNGSGELEIWPDGRIYYDSSFDITDGRLRPVFLDAPMQISGNLTLDSENGAVFNDMPVRDGNGGTGTLSGQVDFGIPQEQTFFDLQLDMQNLRFMDNSDGPDMPFFGTGIGTGVVELTGNNDAPYISTPSPVFMASESNMSIPLDTEESVEGGARFIQFVEDFDFSYDDIYYRLNGNESGNGGADENGEVDLTFMEKFEFDLRFESEEAMSVRLIFDEVTSEVLSARGTGRIRLSLQDEVFQVFGQFDVEGGEYLFVGGDLFARRFTIREGGSINWDGDPVNATIDVAAAYRARPDINQLRGTAGPDATPVRVPVDLILRISGTLESIENEFYFEFPSGADITQTATLAATLNSEDTKLLQATSILLTGNFVPVDTGLNDLFGSQFGAQGLGTLLSSQISSLLNSNLSNLDINLNMTGFDEADLGIALYLFDDRLTLRREGVVTGPNSNIGDFDVTYRINQYLSLEAFHRRESLLPTAVSVGQTQTDESYGVGMEARVQFNTWRELGNRIVGVFRPLFTSGGKKEEQEGETEEEQEENADMADQNPSRE